MGKLGGSLAALVICMSVGATLSYFGLFRMLFLSTQRPFNTALDYAFPIVTLTSNGACNCTFHVGSKQQNEDARSSVECTCDNKHTKEQLDQAAFNQSPPCKNETQLGGVSSNHQETVKESVVRYEPWYAEGRTWHYPVLFPRCSMDVCFNYSRCEGSDELLIYSYDSPSPPVRYFSSIHGTPWHTNDSSKACLFFVYLDLESPHRPHPKTLPYWNDGMNHVLITLADMWRQRGPPQETIGFASVMASDMHETIYRPGFDISIPLPANVHMREMQAIRPFERKYLLTFRGLRYLGRSNEEGVLRSYESFRSMHNGKDVIVVTTCRQATNDLVRKGAPELGLHCEEDEALHSNYSYRDLMNTTFGLVPAGRQPSSYRMAEVLSAGVVPVLIADNYVKPFDTLIQWHRCILQFPSSEIHRVVHTVRAMAMAEVERRQDYCIHIYNEFFKDDDALMRAAIASLKARFFGALIWKP